LVSVADGEAMAVFQQVRPSRPAHQTRTINTGSSIHAIRSHRKERPGEHSAVCVSCVSGGARSSELALTGASRCQALTRRERLLLGQRGKRRFLLWPDRIAVTLQGTGFVKTSGLDVG